MTPFILEYPLAFPPIRIFEVFHDAPYSFLLESGVNHSNLGRFSFIGSDPFLVVRAKGRTIEIMEGGARTSLEGDPFEVLKRLLGQYRARWDWKPAPFLAGAVGFLSYDLNRFIERLPARSLDDVGVPDCTFGFYDRAIIVDHVEKKLYIASTGLPEMEPRAREKLASLRARELAGRVRSLEGKRPEWRLLPPRDVPLDFRSNFTMEEYLEAVRCAKEHIAAGDIYQVNISQRLSANLPVPPFELYKRLRRISPAPFASFLDFGQVVVVGASPERLLQVRDGFVETRPMKGTRPRGKTPSEDRQLQEELLQSEKERAELLMIVDLERNDLGRVCEYGSVRVKALRTLETYATVFQTTATVAGTLRKGQDCIGLVKACFPGGSVTGVPKIRAMEIIDELEPTRRGIYTGSVGYFSFDGDLDLNVVIRTFVLKDGKAFFQVGGGIVADSQPEAEYEETMVKARALIEALLP